MMSLGRLGWKVPSTTRSWAKRTARPTVQVSSSCAVKDSETRWPVNLYVASAPMTPIEMETGAISHLLWLSQASQRPFLAQYPSSHMAQATPDVI